jgi:hypothetical protein
MPIKLISGPTKKKWGQNWSAPDDSINIDTFRYAGVTLSQVCDKLMTFRNRKIDFFKLADHWCVVSGIDGDGSLIYVRTAEQESNERGVLPEIRGFSIRLAGEGRKEFRMLPIAMSSSFVLIPVSQKPNLSTEAPKDLLRTPPEQLKEKRNLQEELGSGICVNGLGNCPPNANPCLRGSEDCPASLSGK